MHRLGWLSSTVKFQLSVVTSLLFRMSEVTGWRTGTQNDSADLTWGLNFMTNVCVHTYVECWDIMYAITICFFYTCIIK